MKINDNDLDNETNEVTDGMDPEWTNLGYDDNALDDEANEVTLAIDGEDVIIQMYDLDSQAVQVTISATTVAEMVAGGPHCHAELEHDGIGGRVLQVVRRQRQQ